MTRVKITEGLHAYFTDPAIYESVNSLVEKLDGKGMPDFQWDEARSYNQALLMAAKIRADLVDFLFQIWEETFGKTGANASKSLSGEFFEPTEYGPSNIWEEKYLARSFYRNNDPDEDKDCDELQVTIQKKNNSFELELNLYQYLESEITQPEQKVKQIDGWYFSPETNDKYAHMRSQRISMDECIKETDGQMYLKKEAVDQLRNAARTIVKELSKKHKTA